MRRNGHSIRDIAATLGRLGTPGAVSFEHLLGWLDPNFLRIVSCSVAN